MKSGDRLRWISCTGKKRYGTFCMVLKVNPKFILVRGDDNRAHIMRGGKPEPLVDLVKKGLEEPRTLNPVPRIPWTLNFSRKKVKRGNGVTERLSQLLELG